MTSDSRQWSARMTVTLSAEVEGKVPAGSVASEGTNGLRNPVSRRGVPTWKARHLTNRAQILARSTGMPATEAPEALLFHRWS
jgi:hypothetical protein